MRSCAGMPCTSLPGHAAVPTALEYQQCSIEGPACFDIGTDDLDDMEDEFCPEFEVADVPFTWSTTLEHDTDHEELVAGLRRIQAAASDLSFQLTECSVPFSEGGGGPCEPADGVL